MKIVDWPFSNPGLGSVFDWGGINGHYDRQSNQVRYDSAKFGGFSFAASVGRDDNDNGGGAATRDASFVGASAKYSFEKITFMGGVESGTRVVCRYWLNLVCLTQMHRVPRIVQAAEAGYDDDTFAYIVGFEASLPAGFGIAAAYKGEEIDNGISQIYPRFILYHWPILEWSMGLSKLGYAANDDAELSGTTASNSSLKASANR